MVTSVEQWVASVGDRRTASRIWVRKAKGKRTFGRPKRRWDCSIKTDIQQVGRCAHWIDLAQERER